MLTKPFTVLLFMVALPCHADDVFLGGVVSAGPVVGDKHGSYVDVAGHAGLALWLIAGAEAKEVDHTDLNAVYAGVGYTSLVQLHIGGSNRGGIYRLKSEIAPFALLHGSVFSDSRDPATSLNRWTISFIYENAFGDNRFSNVSIGVGYAFD